VSNLNAWQGKCSSWRKQVERAQDFICTKDRKDGPVESAYVFVRKWGMTGEIYRIIYFIANIAKSKRVNLQELKVQKDKRERERESVLGNICVKLRLVDKWFESLACKHMCNLWGK